MLRIFFVQCNQHEPTWKSDCYRMKTNKQKETMRSKQITAQTHTCFIMYVTIESNCNFSNNNKYRENIKSPFHWHYVSIWYNVLYCKDMPCSLHSVLWKYSEYHWKGMLKSYEYKQRILLPLFAFIFESLNQIIHQFY